MWFLPLSRSTIAGSCSKKANRRPWPQPFSGFVHGLGRNLRERKAPLFFIERNVKINAASYQQRVFRDALVPWASQHRPRWICALTRVGAGAFGQQDNRRLRRAVSRHLGQGCLVIHSPDLNPMEEKVSATRYATVGLLKTPLTRAWDAITVEECAKIVGNFRKRLPVSQTKVAISSTYCNFFVYYYCYR